MKIINLNSERSVLITAINHPECCLTMLENLTTEHFHDFQTRSIFEAIKKISDRGHCVDKWAIEQELRPEAEFESIMTFFPESTDLGSVLKMNQNIEIIKECHKKYLGSLFVKEFMKDYDQRTLEDLRAVLDDHLDTISPSETETLKSVIQGSFLGCENAYDFIQKGWEAKQSGKEFFKGIRSGYSNIDEATGGFMEGDYILIGGRPGSGKTSFALNLMKNVIDQGHSVGFISLEMTAEQTVLKLLHRGSGIEYKRIVMGDYRNQYEVDTCLAYLKILEHENFYIEAAATGNIGTVISKIKRMKRLYDIKLVCVDYIGLMSTSQKGLNRMDTITEVSEQLRQVFKTLRLPGIVLAQLNRSSVNQDRKPVKEDIRDSDRPVENAHQIFLIYRPPPQPGIIPVTEVILDKVRIAENKSVFFQSNGALFTPFIPADLKDLHSERLEKEFNNKLGMDM